MNDHDRYRSIIDTFSRDMRAIQDELSRLMESEVMQELRKAQDNLTPEAREELRRATQRILDGDVSPEDLAALAADAQAGGGEGTMPASERRNPDHGGHHGRGHQGPGGAEVRVGAPAIFSDGRG